MTDRRSFIEAIRAAPEDDAPRLVYADWLDEHDDSRWATFIRSHVANPDERLASSLPLPLSQTIFAGECWSGLPASQIGLTRGFASRLECTAAFWLQWAAAILAEHPVTSVTLTTVPEVERRRFPGFADFGAERRFPRRLPGREWRSFDALGCPGSDREAIPALLAAEWPSLTFHLPPEPQGGFLVPPELMADMEQWMTAVRDLPPINSAAFVSARPGTRLFMNGRELAVRSITIRPDSADIEPGDRP